MSVTNRTISAIVKTTGEVIEYTYNDKQDLAEAFKDVEAKLEAYRELKNSMLNTSMQLLMKKGTK